MGSTQNDDDTDIKNILEKSYNKISNALTKVGYSDGITEGRDSEFQKGFDLGYADGLKTHFEITKWKTILNSLETQSNLDENLKDCVRNSKEHKILQTPLNQHFQMNQNQGKPVQEISRIQNEYADGIKSTLEHDFEQIKTLVPL